MEPWSQLFFNLVLTFETLPDGKVNARGLCCMPSSILGLHPASLSLSEFLLVSSTPPKVLCGHEPCDTSSTEIAHNLQKSSPSIYFLNKGLNYGNLTKITEVLLLARRYRINGLGTQSWLVTESHPCLLLPCPLVIVLLFYLIMQVLIFLLILFLLPIPYPLKPDNINGAKSDQMENDTNSHSV